jgi:hypothetical protein
VIEPDEDSAPDTTGDVELAGDDLDRQLDPAPR